MKLKLFHITQLLEFLFRAKQAQAALRFIIDLSALLTNDREVANPTTAATNSRLISCI
jgi:hypothetical protein